ncbi:MAG TPA: biopolymer transporter ExbD [Gammaproteobacteria bacterium]|nr:biopolymer transporter ExbD [Gammaproteobacteria bacterium]
MRRRLRHRTRLQQPADINITAFMNLMVILVPFLLITAVFSRITILELNLPAASANVKHQETPRFALEVTVRTAAIEVGDRHGGQIRRIAATQEGHDYAALSELLQQLKTRFPDRLDATLLLEPDTPYDTMVQVMDNMRVARVMQAGSLQTAELFPDISIGDAPPVSLQVAASSRKESK